MLYKTSYAVAELPRNSAGSKQLKRNAVTGRKLRNDSLTGSDVKESSLRTVPSANSADTANTAASATTANTATNVAASEGFHQVGAGGEPGFQNGCTNATSGVAAQEYESVGFYKDKLGVVHLMGLLQCPTTGSAAFQLPAGYRPADNRVLVESVFCAGCGPGNTTGPLNILGAGTGIDGGVLPAGTLSGLDGVTFRAAA